MFTKGDRNSHSALTEALVVQLGMAIVSATFRDGSSTTYSSGKTLQDLISVTRFFRSGSNTLPFGLIGSNSGGYFAMALCNALEDGEVDFLIPICPVANPAARAVYLKHCIDGTTPLPDGKDLYHVRRSPKKARYILEHQEKFFQDKLTEAVDAVASNQHQVPTLFVLGADDKIVPTIVNQQAQHKWACSRTVMIAGAGHELQNQPPSDPDQSYLPDVDRFLSAVILKHAERLPRKA
jgi:pimeloyl-ACP methyl ester carboxylesterase